MGPIVRRVGRVGVAGLFGAALAPAAALGLYAAVGPSPEARAARLLMDQTELWQDDALRDVSTRALRRQNPEWDFMRRTFLALAAADRALVDPSSADAQLALIDDIIARTLADEAAFGHGHFLLSYARFRPWRGDGRSLFVDGEIALMLGARRLVRDDRDDWRDEHARRVATLDAQFAAAPAGLPESYPDEAWLFCVTNALVALVMADRLDGTDHRPLLDAWVARARTELVHPSGLLGSEYRVDGTPLDGPEGSSVWLVVTNLALIDPAFAGEQYDLAVEALIHRAAGLAWASEWGPGWRGPADVDSGPIVPIVDASASSSGFALLASRAFGDGSLHRQLARSLRAADLLLELDPALAEAAGNPMGDVILLYALGFGPLWDTVRRPPSG